MTSDEGIVYDRSLLGVEHPIGSFKVSRDMITGFARSTGETKSIYLGDTDNLDDLVAPPTICNIFVSGVSRPDIKL